MSKVNSFGRSLLKLTNSLLGLTVVCVVFFVIVFYFTVEKRKVISTLKVSKWVSITHIQKSDSDTCSYNSFGCLHLLKKGPSICSGFFNRICTKTLLKKHCGKAAFKKKKNQFIFLCTQIDGEESINTEDISDIKVIESKVEYESL